MNGIGVAEGSLDTFVDLPNGMNISGHQPTAGTSLEGLLGTKDSILPDPLHGKVYVGHNGEQTEVDLTFTEFDLLEYLMRNAGRVVSHEEIYNKVLRYTDLVGDFKTLVRIHTNSLRKKVGDDANNPIYIANVRGGGYKFIGTQKHAADEISLGSDESVSLYPLSMEVYVNDNGKPREVNLTLTEYKIMKFLLSRNGKAASYDDIADNVYGTDNEVTNEYIRVWISTIRKKLGGGKRFIENIQDFGYRCIVPDSNTTTPNMQYHFGEFVLDVDAHHLYQKDRQIRISPSLYFILKLLIEKKGRAATFTELEEVRPDPYYNHIISQEAIRVQMMSLRNLLGDVHKIQSI